MEAYISEPSNRLAVAAFVRWGKGQHISLAHPSIQIPSNVQADDKGGTTITLDENLLKDKKDDSSSAWLMYGLARATWPSKKFSEEYPRERTYRHSLKEEADALRSVIEVAKEKSSKPNDLDPPLATLMRLDQDGVLESNILLARSDAGIAQDYPAYLKEHRENLRRYTLEWVLKGGQKGK